MTTDDKNEKPKQDWNQLASEALDLWQNHLTSLASDPKAKEEMTNLVAPMGKMFSDWTRMVQESMQALTPETPHSSENTPQAQEEKAQAAPKEKAEAVPTPVNTPESQAPQNQDKDMSHEPESLSAGAERHVSDNSESIALAVPQSAPASSASTRGRTLPADGARNLAELADRLAFLECELEGLRAKKRGADLVSETNESVQHVVGTDTGSTSV